MAKGATDDDFVGTIYDDDDFAEDEEAESDEQAPPPQPRASGKKRKLEDAIPPANKKQRKRNTEIDDGDGEMESDFDFQLDDGVGELDDDEVWADEGQDAIGARGIDEIVSDRKKRGGIAALEESEDEENADLSDEEMLADDAFGMQANPDDEDSEGEHKDAEDEDEDEDEDQSEVDDNVAAPMAHPDDLEPADSSDESEDEAEVERQKAFFAPESHVKGSGKTDGAHNKAWKDFHLDRSTMMGLSASGFNEPTPIQARTIPWALEGRDIVGSAVTGSGKTGAFIIPILERLQLNKAKDHVTRVVVLLPTRELALQAYQVATKLAYATDITFGQAIGGLNQKVQETALKLRPDIVIATPGRFIDFMRNSPHALQTDGIEILVLDEADRMLEDGFADELNEILTALPRSRQTMLFSATMTSTVDALIRVGCSRPVRVAVDAQHTTVSGLTQEFIRLRPGKEHLRLAYLLHLVTTSFRSRTIVFFRQKALAHRTRVLFALLGLQAAELHGAMTQEQRIQAVEAFRAGKAAFLLATDLASRGLDIKNVDAVINFDAPQSHEIYLHRVGRTARAGRSGRACTLAAEPDRKVVKAAVKAGRAQGAVIKSRSVPGDEADKWERKTLALEGEIEAVLKEEKEERVLKTTEMQARRAENIMTHEKEILARPKKTWFQGQKDKAAAKEAGRTALNGKRPAGGAQVDEGEKGLDERIADKMAEGGKKKPSNKEKKRMALKDERSEVRMWKKGKDQRGKGLDPSKNKKKPAAAGVKSKTKPNKSDKKRGNKGK